MIALQLRFVAGAGQAEIDPERRSASPQVSLVPLCGT
jgi:hypothetical protein